MKDPIERQAAIDRAVSIPMFGRDIKMVAVSEIENLPSAQPDVPNTNDGDMISRQAAIDALHMHLMYRMGTDSNKKRLDEWINGVPSVQPERKKGKWNFIGDNMFECTYCGVAYTTQQLNGLRNYNVDPYAPKFCPNCGADMRGEQDE